MVWSSAQIDDERHDHQAGEHDDFEGGAPEFKLAKVFYRGKLHGRGEDHEDGDPDTAVDLGRGYPVLDNDSASRKLRGGSNEVF